MSLRIFHIFFIATTSTLAILGGVWALYEHKPLVWAVASFLCGIGLDAYLIWFIKKSRGLSP